MSDRQYPSGPSVADAKPSAPTADRRSASAAPPAGERRHRSATPTSVSATIPAIGFSVLDLASRIESWPLTGSEAR